jgi:signal peptidase II
MFQRQYYLMAHKLDKSITGLFFIAFTLDRVTKYMIMHDLIEEQFINRFFNIDISHNHGFAWGIANQCTTHTWLITVIVACALIYFTWHALAQMHDRIMTFASTLIIAGGLSNFFDRMYYGSVIDFIQLHINDCYFPTFNIADICISIGAWMLLTAWYYDRT